MTPFYQDRGRTSYSETRRKRFNKLNRKVECEVSGRWLQFPKKIDKYYENGDRNITKTYMHVDVMTEVLSDEEDKPNKTKKLCTLVITLEDIVAIIDDLTADLKAESGK